MVAACAPVVPHVDGAPVAPSAPDRVWIAPRAARDRDSLSAAQPLPTDLAARSAALTLGDVVDLALRNNPATRVSWAQARAAADVYGAARASYLPVVNGLVAGPRSAQSSAGAGAAGGFDARTSYVPSVSLSYALFDFGARSGSVRSAREMAFASAYTHNRVIQTTVLQVEAAYFAYASARGLREAQATSVQEAQASYAAALARDSVGIATIADVLQAKTALAQAQLQLQTAEAQLHLTWSTLALALGIPPTAQYDVTALPEDVPVGEVATSVDYLIDAALRERPDLQAAHANEAAARAEIRIARSAALPSLSLSAGDQLAPSSGGPSTERSYAVLFSLQVPIFDGGARGYDIARAQALAQLAAGQATAQRQTVMADVYTSYYSLRAATQQVRSSEDLLASATASMRAARARYTAGVASILDLLTAQTALAAARAQRAQSRWVWAQALASLGYATGALDAEGRVAVPIVPDTSRSVLP